MSPQLPLLGPADTRNPKYLYTTCCGEGS